MRIKLIAAIAVLFLLSSDVMAECRFRTRLKRVVPVAKVVVSTPIKMATAPIIYLQENKPVRTVINSVPPFGSLTPNCSNGTCTLE